MEIIDKAKNFIKNNKGKIAAAAAGLGAAAAGYYMYNHTNDATTGNQPNGDATTGNQPNGDATTGVKDDTKDIMQHIKQFESSNKDHLTPYKDNRGIYTIGHGINLQDLDPQERSMLHIPSNINTPEQVAEYLKDHPITQQQEDLLLKHNLDIAKQDISRIFGKPYDQMEPRVRKLLTDMDYNMGASSLASFHNAIAEYKAHGATPKFFEEIKNSKYYKEQLPKNQARYQYISGLMNA